jgi:hypothetical protein
MIQHAVDPLPIRDSVLRIYQQGNHDDGFNTVD